MSVRTRCPNLECRTVLNLPDGAEGKKLKCPRCGTKFRPGEPGTGDRPSAPAMDTAREASTTSAQAVPVHRQPPRREDDDLPIVGDGSLRERFDPRLLEDDEAPKRPPAPSGGSYEVADAAGLLDDDEPTPRHRRGAPARSESRRCSCGGVVPAGMSLCPRCGLDLDTGARDESIDLIDTDEPSPMPRREETPFGILLVGAMAALVSAVLALASVYLYFTRAGADYRWGYLPLAAVGGYGVYAAFRLIAGKSARPLLAALMLGAVIDLIALVILPLAVPEAPAVIVEPEGPTGGARQSASDADLYVPVIVPMTERINWQQVNAGLAILAVAGLLAAYLNSKGVRRYARH